VDLPLTAERLLHKIDVFDHARIHGGDLSRVMAAENVVEVVQRRQIVSSALVTIPDTQPLIGVNVVERQFAFRKDFRLSASKTWHEQLSAQAEHACHRSFQ